MTQDKSTRLTSILNELDSFVIAFSGGVDSSFLLHRACAISGLSVIAVTIRTPYIPEQELNDAADFIASRNINHVILDLPLPEEIRKNPDNRCYLCKKILFDKLVTFAMENNYKYVVDGSNADDPGDFRPGMKALEEMGIRSPLLEAGLSKTEIRELSRDEGLGTWDKPAFACLLTRLPYMTEVSNENLKIIEQAESMLCARGYPGVRVRVHGDLARIECLPGYIDKLIHSAEREYIIIHLRKLGFRYVSLDLEG